MPDTSVSAQQHQDAIVRGLAPAERLRQALDLSEFTRALALAQLQRASPALSERAIVVQLARQRYGADVLPPGLT